MTENDSTPIGCWTTVDVAGHPCSVFEPGQPHPHGFTVLYLHAAGLEDPADDPRMTAEFDRRGLRVAAPHTGSSWWCDRICPSFDPLRSAERYLLDDVLPFLFTHVGAKPSGIALFGISMGGQGALRLAYKYPNAFPVVGAISAAIDFHRWLDPQPFQPELASQLRQLYRDTEHARQDTATLHIHPLNWPRHQFFCTDPDDHWHESADRLRMKLSSLGVPHDCDLETSAGGHGWDYFHAMLPRVLDFLVAGLERERLRVV